MKAFHWDELIFSALTFQATHRLTCWLVATKSAAQLDNFD